MKKKIFTAFAIMFFDINLLASGTTTISAANLFLLNYDAISEGVGGSAAAFSKNSLSFINSPSSNYDVLAISAVICDVIQYISAQYIRQIHAAPTQKIITNFNKRVKSKPSKNQRDNVYLILGVAFRPIFIYIV
ncbi:MAG: hypothetical protein LBR79_05400 [Oscillospiraceae bacterium]|jgi:hypothetical protein|nr:hypothetical protein [Oscillospiraceae bacterium]